MVSILAVLFTVFGFAGIYLCSSLIILKLGFSMNIDKRVVTAAILCIHINDFLYY